MELTKEQIRQIDRYLQDKGVKYWDLRLEMIDHYASKVEHNKIQFSQAAMQEEFGYGHNLQSDLQKRMKLINIKYRNLFHKEILSFLKSTKGILIMLLFFAFEIVMLNSLTSELFVKINLWMFMLTIIPIVLYGLFYLFTNYRSLHLNHAFFYSFISFLILQLPINLFQGGHFLEVSEQAYKIILLIIIPLHIIFTYCGHLVFKKVKSFYNETYKSYKEACS